LGLFGYADLPLSTREKNNLDGGKAYKVRYPSGHYVSVSELRNLSVELNHKYKQQGETP
jgi:hypothetical protein